MTIKGFLGFREKYILFALEGNETDTSMGDVKSLSETLNRPFFHVRENHGIREVSSDLLLTAKPTVRWDQVAQGSILLHFENLQGWRQHSLSGPSFSASLSLGLGKISRYMQSEPLLI